MREFIIAIDGYASSGKGTLSKLIANELDFDYLDTGKLYRSLAYCILDKENSVDDKGLVISMLNENLKTEIMSNIGLEYLISPEISQAASTVASYQEVRDFLHNMQIDFPNGKEGVVVDGRDITSVIFPNADVKFFVTADPKVRAERRFQELSDKLEGDISLDKVYEDILSRDEKDTTRESAPLIKTEDSYEVDTSKMTIDEMFMYAIDIIEKKL